ncbi:MAG: LuxR C-terminal-related transcriptional regulator [Lachnospiraceae bacterium]
MSEKKLHKPVADAYYVRPRAAWEQMKAAQNTRQTVYIYGASGTGKTSFAADFFARKRYYYASVADTGIAEISGAVPEKADAEHETLNAQTILVIDDLHLLETQEDRSACGQLIEKLSARKDVWLILISRAPVPKWLKSVFVRYVFVTIGEEALCLTEQEQEKYLEKWELSPTEAACKRIRELGNGHPLYLRIVVMRLKSIPEEENAKDREGAELRAIEESRKDLWDYAEVHVYDQWSVELQEFLEAVSIVEQFDLQMAQQLTKKKDAGKLIQKAQEMGSFLMERRENERSIYELRTPMKYSMRRRISGKYSQDYLKELYYSAGNSYEMEGNVREALRMYEMCHSEEGISRILIENMRRNPASGEYFELRRYYLALPEEKIKDSVELMAGMSMLQSLLLNEEESERWYQELLSYAKEKTGGMKREAEARLLYLDIALPQRGTVRMTDLLKQAGVLLTERKMVLPEFSVTSNLPSMMNGGKDFCEWSRKDKELAKTIGKVITLVLGRYGKGLVDIALAESFFEKGGDDYEVAALAGRGRMQAESGGKTEQVFVAVGILTQLSMLNNRMEDAMDMLESFRQVAEQEAPKLLPNIRAMSVRMDLYTGRISDAYQWLEEAPDEDAEFNCLERYRYLTKVRVYLAAGRKEKALLLLDKLYFYAEKMHRTYITIEVMLLKAIALYRIGKEGWQETLQEAVTRAEDYHFVRILTREGVALRELFKAGTVTWKDTDFKKQVMKECEQMAGFYPAYLKEKQEGNVILSDKALKILRFQAEGMSVEKIAEQLGLSKAGVKYYNQETYKKLGVNNKAAAVTEARKRKLL